jgi:hypothetical protein
MTISQKIKATFFYNNLGRGQLRLMDGDAVLMNFLSRTGSIAKDGKLQNALPVQPWYLCTGIEKPVKEEEYAMFVEGKVGIPWKQRLWPLPVPAAHERMGGYLIHPDGGKGGTLGCIGPQETNAMEWYYWMEAWFNNLEQIIIPLEVKRI